MAKVDTKDAHYSVLILLEHQKYLILLTPPPPLSYLRLQKVTVTGFIDDLITLGEVLSNVKGILNLLKLFLIV